MIVLIVIACIIAFIILWLSLAKVIRRLFKFQPRHSSAGYWTAITAGGNSHHKK